MVCLLLHRGSSLYILLWCVINPNCNHINITKPHHHICYAIYCHSFNTVLSQQCYNQPNCAGIAVAVSTAKECCIETNDGMSVAADNGTCIVSQCVGNWNASCNIPIAR